MIIRLEHAPKALYGGQRINELRSSWFRKYIKTAPLSFEGHNEIIKKAVLDSPSAPTQIAGLPPGVHLYAHNHMPNRFEIDGRLFVNPGSAGQPLNGSTLAQYAILWFGGGSWGVEFHGAEYDVAAAAAALENSEMAQAAPFWVELSKQTLLAGLDYFSEYLHFLDDYAKSLGDGASPVTNETWRLAIEGYKKRGGGQPVCIF